MEIYTTTQARTNLFKLIDYTNVSHEPVHIVGKHNKAVLIAEDDYRAMVETLFLISIPGMKDSIIKASKEPLDTFEEAIDWDNV